MLSAFLQQVAMGNAPLAAAKKVEEKFNWHRGTDLPSYSRLSPHAYDKELNWEP